MFRLDCLLRGERCCPELASSPSKPTNRITEAANVVGRDLLQVGIFPKVLSKEAKPFLTADICFLRPISLLRF